MEFYEKLSWILDKNTKRLNNDDECQINIDFVHSLGKKCDCVGWSELNSNEADFDRILDEIYSFCKNNGWKARGFYEREFVNVKSDWYILTAEEFKESTYSDRISVPANNADTMYLSVIKAYHELIPAPKEDYGEICVPERFRNACIKHGINDIDFCWVEDKGKYDSEQYFYIFPKKLIPRVASTHSIKKQDKQRLNSLGGALPRIAEIFNKLTYISTPECFLKEDIPEGGIAYAFCQETDDLCGIYHILIHKDTAEILLKGKALTVKNLKAVPVLDTCPDGYTLEDTVQSIKATQSYIEGMLDKYKTLKLKKRPEYIVTDKETIKILRKKKSERKADFNKSIKKELAQTLIHTQYKPLLDYYKVANGGLLSEDYTLLSFEESLSTTFELCEGLEKEELLESNPKGIVFAQCINGDNIILFNNGNVKRFSHESPEVIDEWKTLSQFILEAISEN